jgi:hypothetical protein
MYGTARAFALFGICGLAGSFASYLASPAGVSAGASGAIFGMLGAVFIELTYHRQKYRTAWKRGMWGGLVVVTLAQLGIGFMYPAIDQWAHGAGLFAGLLAGFLLSPSAKWTAISRNAGRIVAVAFAALAIAAAVLVVRTSLIDSFTNAPHVQATLNNVTFSAPATYVHATNELVDPDGIVIISAVREPLHSIAEQMTAAIAEAQAAGRSRGFAEITVPNDRAVPLPDGWEGSERVGSFEDVMGVRQHYRIVIAGKVFGPTLVVIVVTTPDSIAREAASYFTQLFASVRP